VIGYHIQREDGGSMVLRNVGILPRLNPEDHDLNFFFQLLFLNSFRSISVSVFRSVSFTQSYGI